ncbi:RNA polymerase sigma-70 factor, ECF subfamily [Salegentibacter salarius]|nr:RNA polymerase sigma-70 factor, ECF subfamily [Salegentibacter salarius]
MASVTRDSIKFIKTSIPLKTSEDLLIKRLQEKKTSSEAFKELVSLYKERLYWHIRNMVKDHEDTHDVLQNTFIKVFKNIHNFKGESKLFSWMYRIATNEAISFLNKRAKRNQISSEDLQQQLIANLESDVYFEGDEIQLKLQKAIASLPAKQQQVFNMKYFQELKYREMSEILETSEGALKASYHHAAKKIEEYLKTN